MTARHRNEPLDDSCEALHLRFAKSIESIVWLKGLGKWLLGLVGISAGTLLLTFAAVVKYGMEMSASNKEMQAQIVVLTKDVTELKETDKKICADMDKLKKRASPYGGLKTESEHPWSE